MDQIIVQIITVVASGVVFGLLSWAVCSAHYSEKYKELIRQIIAKDNIIEYYEDNYIPKPGSIELKYKEQANDDHIQRPDGWMNDPKHTSWEEWKEKNPNWNKDEAAKMDEVFGKVKSPSPEYSVDALQRAHQKLGQKGIQGIIDNIPDPPEYSEPDPTDNH